MTNIPALKLAVKRNLIKENYEDELPLPFKLQTNRIKIENSILFEDQIISLNRFQKRFLIHQKRIIQLVFLLQPHLESLLSFTNFYLMN